MRATIHIPGKKPKHRQVFPPRIMGLLPSLDFLSSIQSKKLEDLIPSLTSDSHKTPRIVRLVNFIDAKDFNIYRGIIFDYPKETVYGGVFPGVIIEGKDGKLKSDTASGYYPLDIDLWKNTTILSDWKKEFI